MKYIYKKKGILVASYVLEEIVYCKNCGHDTLHRKMLRKMSWLMHLFLTVITAGLWLIVWGLCFYGI